MTEEEKGYDANLDFDLTKEATEDALIITGDYFGAITKVTNNKEMSAIVFNITFAENGVMCDDNTTPVDGAVLTYRVWLPKEGDENTMTASGRWTKRQWKINNMADVAKKLGINMNSMNEINQSIDDAEWIGIEVQAKVGVNEYEGVISNEIKRLINSTQ